MKIYRMQASATICFDVEAKSEAEAVKKAERAIADYSFGYNLEDGEGYSDVQLYADEETSADVVDERELARMTTYTKAES